MPAQRAPLLLTVLLLLGGARAGYLHAPVPLPVHVPAPVVSYGYHTAVVTKPLAVPLPHPLPYHPLPHPLPYHPLPYHPLPVHHPPPVIIKPIATSYQSFHKVSDL